MKQGDILKFVGDDEQQTIMRMKVLGVCGSIIFTHDINSDGSTTSPSFAEEEFLVTLGWVVEEPNKTDRR